MRNIIALPLLYFGVRQGSDVKVHLWPNNLEVKSVVKDLSIILLQGLNIWIDPWNTKQAESLQFRMMDLK